jgi:signal transduction histidine kinase
VSPDLINELQSAAIEALITIALAALCLLLFAQYRKPYFRWWAIAWGMHVLRIGAITQFLASYDRVWLFIHHVLTGLTALALLWASIAFSHQRSWRRRYLAVGAFPVVWSYIAVYWLPRAVSPWATVLFLAVASFWTAWVFYRFQQRAPSLGARLLAGVFFAWGVHHLDYPILRRSGAWEPWGYLVDILFLLVIAAGTILLVLEDLNRGLRTLSTLSSDLQPERSRDDVVGSLLARPLALPGVRGSALYLRSGSAGRFVAGAGSCASWNVSTPSDAISSAVARLVEQNRPDVFHELAEATPAGSGSSLAYIAVLPVGRGENAEGALVIVGTARDPFTALGDEFLITVSRHVGAALANANLYERLEARSDELQRLSRQMVRQHEEERRRISLELHDETAQVFAAVRMQLGVVRESATPDVMQRLDRVLALVDTGIRSIRSVGSDMRPPLLDDLGFIPALRALASDFAERADIPVTFELDESAPLLGPAAELALFRTMQEALSNVARHAAASAVRVSYRVDAGSIMLTIEDNGCGVATTNGAFARNGHAGIPGMRERLVTLGGSLEIASRPGQGTRVIARIPSPELGIA